VALMPRQSVKLATGGELTLTCWPGDDESAALGFYTQHPSGHLELAVALSLEELAALGQMIAKSRAEEAA
jgi:hypothetical protein